MWTLSNPCEHSEELRSFDKYCPWRTDLIYGKDKEKISSREEQGQEGRGTKEEAVEGRAGAQQWLSLREAKEGEEMGTSELQRKGGNGEDEKLRDSKSKAEIGLRDGEAGLTGVNGEQEERTQHPRTIRY